MRLARRIIVFLLIGAVINVAVAWGCAYGAVDWLPLRNIERFGHVCRREQMDTYPAWVEDRLNELDRVKLELMKTTANSNSVPAFVVFDRSREAVVAESGWPVFAMAATCYRGIHDFRVPLSLGGDGRHQVLANGIAFETSVFRQMILGSGQLPLRALWPGFAINTLFYAAIVGMLWMTPGVFRRWRRRRRGRCVKCGYDLRSSGVQHPACPECGASTLNTSQNL